MVKSNRKPPRIKYLNNVLVTAKPYRLAELFCGCGGFSHGFAQTGRFSVELGSDLSEVFCETFARNHFREDGRTALVIPGDLEKLSRAEIPLAFRSLGYHDNGRLDVLLGGPPCEGFSQNKRSEEKDDQTGETRYGGYKRYINDPRNFLVRRFLRVVEDVTPKIVVIENVPQILTHDHGRFGSEITARLQGMKYEVMSRVLIAADYGIPQVRKRAFFVAIREDVFRKAGWPAFPPRATHEVPQNGHGRKYLHLKPAVTVREAIGDLPESADIENGGKPTSLYPQLTTLSPYAKNMRSRNATPFNHVHRIVRQSALERLKHMKPGMRLEHLPERLRTKSWYFNCYGRLAWDSLARTITKSCNYVGSGCFGHPELDRGITMREAARLQSFNDDFRFWSDSEHQVANMVGGAVPPLLAKAIADIIVEYLDRASEGT